MAWRRRPPFVRSTNSSSQRRSGFTQTHWSIFSFVRPWPERLGSGRFANGQLGVTSGLSSWKTSARRCGVNPPAELATHRCIGWRPAPKASPYRWEFAKRGTEFRVAVAPEITTSDMALMIKMAVAGAGITFGMEESFRPFIAQGLLIPLLEDYCPHFPGFYLYYPNRKNVAPKLRALIDHLKPHA